MRLYYINGNVLLINDVLMAQYWHDSVPTSDTSAHYRANAGLPFTVQSIKRGIHGGCDDAASVILLQWTCYLINTDDEGCRHDRLCGNPSQGQSVCSAYVCPAAEQDWRVCSYRLVWSFWNWELRWTGGHIWVRLNRFSNRTRPSHRQSRGGM